MCVSRKEKQGRANSKIRKFRCEVLHCHPHTRPVIHHLLILMAEFFRYPQRKSTQAVGTLTEHFQTFILLFQLLLRSVGIITEASKNNKEKD